VPVRPELLIWPEGTLPVFEQNDRQYRLYRRLTAWSRMRNVALLTGAYTTNRARSSYFNTALLFRGDEQPQEYEKLHLAPLTERLPVSAPSPILAAMALPTGNTRLESGQQRVVLNGEDYRIGTSIGMESFYGDHNRLHVSDGADILVALAHNGWWGRSPGSSQHIRLTRLRAIETRRSVVVSTVSGTSGVVYPNGQIETIAGWMKEESARRDIPLLSEETTYVRLGDWLGRYARFPAAGFFLLWGLSAAFGQKSKRKSRNRSRSRKR
ncbi:MAG: apolipoprotein N-acyltransferase, partial [Rubricoccaceae bacterium]|nr:apolipoprotein N-acyltransferase [Rubricoccaceae bacterium]